MPVKILAVDDDAILLSTITAVLRQASYAAIVAYTAEDGVRLAQTERPDLILLDVMIPNIGGWAACQQIRRFSDAPIIFLTALGAVENVVRGLEMGADDYMVKPFEQMELLARVKAHLRRRETAVSRRQMLSFGDGRLTIDLDARLVTVNGRVVALTPREFDLLTTLADNAGRVLSSADLARKAWGLTDPDARNSVKPYVHYLRKKIETDPAAPRWILTVRGIGYRLGTGD